MGNEEFVVNNVTILLWPWFVDRGQAKLSLLRIIESYDYIRDNGFLKSTTNRLDYAIAAKSP